MDSHCAISSAALSAGDAGGLLAGEFRRETTETTLDRIDVARSGAVGLFCRLDECECCRLTDGGATAEGVRGDRFVVVDMF